MRTIIVEKYDPKWHHEFEKAKAFYEGILRNLNIQIEHVGSTSVPGLWAKPILDIDIIADSKEDVIEAIKALESCGYIHVGNLGVEGREAFKYEEDNKNITWMEHHLYVCLRGSENLENHILLRERLRKDADAVKRYSKLKIELAEKFPNDINSYIDGKTELITNLLREEGMEDENLKKIENINKK